MTFGEKVRQARRSKGLSQEELAEKLGKSRRTVIDWESDKALPRTRKVCEELAEVLGLNVSVLLSDDSAFISEAGEMYGYRGRRDARELVAEISGLFAGGDMAEEDMDTLMLAIHQAYMDAKLKNKKYAPGKGRDAHDND